MNRTKLTHVRKFGGVWFQLVCFTSFDELLDTYCFGCDIKRGSIICNDSPCGMEEISVYGGIWKEIGKI